MALTDPDDPDDHGGPDTETLPCSADLAELWDTGRPAPGHRDCPECTAALDAREALEHTVRTALDEDRAPAAEPAFLERVMAAVRTELRPGPLVPLGEPDDEEWITAAAAAGALRAAIDALPGVSAGRCRLAPLDERRPTPRTFAPGHRLPRGPLRAEVEVFADLRRPLPRTTALVRAAVAEAAALRVGLAIREVDVTVRDLLPGNGDT
ncbi:hypothetical protein ACFV6F_01690 [Kitasatospora phosalacinea]|uniref:hypothetical protein n=1 Tax=Kitasatospora phosalacinea TaxID=2065 RepID=UPI00364A28E8